MRPLLCHLSYAAVQVGRAENLQGYGVGVKLTACAIGAVVPEIAPVRQRARAVPGSTFVQLTAQCNTRGDRTGIIAGDNAPIAAWGSAFAASTPRAAPLDTLPEGEDERVDVGGLVHDVVRASSERGPYDLARRGRGRKDNGQLLPMVERAHGCDQRDAIQVDESIAQKDRVVVVGPAEVLRGPCAARGARNGPAVEGKGVGQQVQDCVA